MTKEELKAYEEWLSLARSAEVKQDLIILSVGSRQGVPQRYLIAMFSLKQWLAEP